MRLAALILLFLSLPAFSAPKDCEAKLVAKLIDTDSFRLPATMGKTPEQLRGDIAYWMDRIHFRTEEMKKLEAKLAKATEETLISEYKRGIAEHKGMIPDLLMWVADAEAELERATKNAKNQPDGLAEAQAHVAKKIAKTPALGRHIQDWVNFEFLKDLPRSQAVSLLIGSPRTKPSAWEIETGRRIVSVLSERGYLVLLDGHSAVTPHLLDSGNVLAVVSSENAQLPPEKTLFIGNPYMVFEGFQKQHLMISSFTSVMAIAQAIHGESVHFVAEQGGEFIALREWKDETVRAGFWLGLNDYKRMPIAKNLERFLSLDRFPEVKVPAKYVPLSYEDLDIRSLRDAAEYANHMFALTPQVEGPKAVVFGSSQMNKDASPLVYDVAYEFGKYRLGVATGGSGGAMLAANMGAYDAGGDSLGIPMGGGFKLESEKKTFSEVQTATVKAEGYEERIPWLLHGREVIANAPGGSGTMREVAASLVWLSQQENPKAVLLFLKKSYYQPLVKLLQSLPIDPEILSRIAVVDSKAELHAAMKAFASQGRFNLKKYMTPGRPRAERSALPEEKIETSSPSEKGSEDEDWMFGGSWE